jgi:large subunit ribosomal protein L25
MDAISLQVEPRTPGKSASRAIRREEKVPCVLYGPHAEPTHFSVPVLDLRPLIYTSETHTVSIALDGETYDAILKEVIFHPVTDVPQHADFYALTAGETITMTVPVVLVGDAKGVKAGGSLLQQINELDIECLPKDIPSQVEINVADMEMGDSVHVSELSIENVTILTDADRTVVSVVAPRAVVEEEAEADETALDELAQDGAEDAAEAADGSAPAE